MTRQKKERDMRKRMPSAKDIAIAKSVRALSEFCALLFVRLEELICSAEATKRLLIRHRCFSNDEYVTN